MRNTPRALARTLALGLALPAAWAACSSSGDRPRAGGNDGAAGNGASGGGGGGGSGGAGPGSDAGAPPWDAPPLGPWSGGFTDPGLDPAAPGKFGGAVDPANKPWLAYPLADSMHPINLGDITFQWSSGAETQKVFRLRFENARGKADFFFGCTGTTECVHQMPETEWLAMARDNVGADVTFTIAGTDGMGGPVASSDPLTLRFSPEPVKGGLYYWSTALQGTYRMNFGAKKAEPFITPSSKTNADTCSGCHSVSRDGTTIAFTAGHGSGRLQVAPTSDPTMPTVKPMGVDFDSSTMALSPDGSRVIVSIRTDLILRDTADGKTLATVDPDDLGSAKAAFFPEWSPDGKDIVLTLADKQNDEGYGAGKAAWDIATGSIAILPYNDGAFGPAKTVVPSDDKDFNFYPSWSPDGKWIAFTSAPVGSHGKGSLLNPIGDSTYNEPKARLRLVSRDGGTVYELARATQGIGHTSTWPKFTPFVQAGGDVIFIAFNTKIDYGFLLKNSTLSDNPYSALDKHKHPQLWMFAIDLRQLSSGDPSTAPIWLPFQDVSQQNHLPFWTTVIRCKMGTADGVAGSCGAGEMCVAGVCTRS